MTPWTAAYQASLSITNSPSLLKLMSIKSVMPSNHFILCPPLLLPSVFHSITVFSNESVLHIRWPKYWSFNLCISPSNGYWGLISFRIDWFDLLVVQGTLKGLLQYQVQKHQCAQLPLWSNSHIHTWLLEKPQLWLDGFNMLSLLLKSLLFNTLSRLVIAFLLRNKCLLISRLQ